MTRIPNRTLVQQLKSGERRACTTLVSLYQSRLLHEAENVFHLSPEDGEEIVNDVLLAVVQNIHSFEFKKHDSDFHVWVLTLFRNRVRDAVRQLVAKEEYLKNIHLPADGTHDLSSTDKEVLAEVVRQYGEAIRSAEDENTDAVAGKLLAIADALERLEPWERVLLRCRALNVSYEEIAGYTGRPAHHLKVYHGRIKKKFVRMVREYYPELKENEN